MAEWSIATDCKSVAYGLRRFESCPTHQVILFFKRGSARFLQKTAYASAPTRVRHTLFWRKELPLPFGRNLTASCPAQRKRRCFVVKSRRLFKCGSGRAYRKDRLAKLPCRLRIPHVPYIASEVQGYGTVRRIETSEMSIGYSIQRGRRF